MSDQSAKYPNIFQQKRSNRTKLSSLADQIYDYLRAAIIRGQLAAGEKLVELDIAAEMGTSQGPVREALQRLERDGLVERQARSATFVSSISTEEMYELFSIRCLVECFAIRRPIQHITPRQCDELQELVEQMGTAGRLNDILALAEHDMQFHRRICEWSESRPLLRAWVPLFSQIQRFVVQTHTEYFPDLVALAGTHRPIVDVLRSGDAENAARVVQDHIMLIWSMIDPNKD